MTQVGESGQGGGNPFKRCWPGRAHCDFPAAGFVGRMRLSMFGLGTVTDDSVGDEYGLAGTWAAVGLGSATRSARRRPPGFFADRFRASARVLFAAALAVVFAATHVCSYLRGEVPGALGTMLLATGGLAGPSMTSRADDESGQRSAFSATRRLLHTAFSLESSSTRRSFVIAGRHVVTMLATRAVQPTWAGGGRMAGGDGGCCVTARCCSPPSAGPSRRRNPS